MDKNDFKFVMPADLEKAEDGSWKIRGLASTQHIDQQGETIIQKGVDLTPIDQKKGILNWDHLPGPENTIGLLDGYKKSENGLYVEGRLFKNHSKAKAVREIMDSLGEGDKGRMGLSVEGKILERDPTNPKIIKKCRINAVALTMNPVNDKTYADIVKSMNSAEEVEFDLKENDKESQNEEATFTTSQVVAIIQKALSAGAAGMKAPNARTGGEALSQQDIDKGGPGSGKKKDEFQPGIHWEKLAQEKKDAEMDRKWKRRQASRRAQGRAYKRVKKMTKSMYKSNLQEVMSKLALLYPDVPKTDLWVAVSERLRTKFPDINESFGKGGEGSGKRGHQTNHDKNWQKFLQSHGNVSSAGHKISAKLIQRRINKLDPKTHNIAINDLKRKKKQHEKAAEMKKGGPGSGKRGHRTFSGKPSSDKGHSWDSINNALMGAGFSNKQIAGILDKMPRKKESYSWDSVNSALMQAGYGPKRIANVLSQMSRNKKK